jgi:hypothetical protein
MLFKKLFALLVVGSAVSGCATSSGGTAPTSVAAPPGAGQSAMPKGGGVRGW